MSFRITPLLRKKFFTTASRARAAVPLDAIAASHFTSPATVAPRLGRLARWSLPTMAIIAAGMTLASRRPKNTLDVANRHIYFSIYNTLHEANRKVHAVFEPTQEEKNQILMEMYGERSSLEDMERAIAGIEAKTASPKDRAKVLEEAYGDRGSLKDLERAMQLYEVQ